VTETDGGEGKLADLDAWPESHAFSEPERVALEYAETMTYTGRKVDDVLSERLKQHFSEPQIVELTAAIALDRPRRGAAGLLPAAQAIAARPALTCHDEIAGREAIWNRRP